MESIRFLVVEDDQDINNLRCTILRDGGYAGRSGRTSTWCCWT